MKDQFIAFGGILRDGEGVVEIHPGSLITIKTTKDLFKSHKVILTAGKSLISVMKLEVFFYLDLWFFKVCCRPGSSECLVGVP